MLNEWMTEGSDLFIKKSYVPWQCDMQGGIHKLNWQDFEDFWPPLSPLHWKFYNISFISIVGIDPPLPMFVNVVYGCLQGPRYLLIRSMFTVTWRQWLVVFPIILIFSFPISIPACLFPRPEGPTMILQVHRMFPIVTSFNYMRLGLLLLRYDARTQWPDFRVALVSKIVASAIPEITYFLHFAFEHALSRKN